MENLWTNVADTINLEPLFLFLEKRNVLVDGKVPLLWGQSLHLLFIQMCIILLFHTCVLEICVHSFIRFRYFWLKKNPSIFCYSWYLNMFLKWESERYRQLINSYNAESDHRKIEQKMSKACFHWLTKNIERDQFHAHNYFAKKYLPHERVNHS